MSLVLSSCGEHKMASGGNSDEASLEMNVVVVSMREVLASYDGISEVEKSNILANLDLALSSVSQSEEVHVTKLLQDLTSSPQDSLGSVCLEKSVPCGDSVVSRKAYLNNVLFPQKDQAIVEVAKKRKAIPYQCATHFAKRCKAEVQSMRSPSCEVRASGLMESSSPASKLSLEKDGKLDHVAKGVAKLMQDLPRDIEDVEHLLEGVDMHLQQCKTKTDNVLYQTP